VTPQEFLDEFGTLAEAEGGVQKLRELILELAVRGKLVEQDESESPASELLESIKESGANNGKKRAPRRNEASSLLHDPPFEVPSSWEWSPFNRVATIASNLVKPAEFLDLPHVAPNNIEKYNGQLLEYRSVREDGVKSNNHRFFAGQILYSKIRPNLTKATIVDFNGLCSADVYPLDSHIDARYLLTFILSFPFLQMAVKTDTRVAMPKINQTELNQVLVAVPPLAEQQRIVAKVDELMRLCDGLETVQKQRRGVRLRLNRSSLDRLTVVQSPAQVSAAWQRVCDHFEVLYDTPETLPDLRQTILQLAVQGKLVPQDPNDEPASELLPRIEQDRKALEKAKKIDHLKVARIDESEAPFSIPFTWSWTTLSALALKLHQGINTAADKVGYAASGYRILQSKHMTSGVITDGDARFVGEDDFAAYRQKFNPQKSDILFANIGTIGKSVIVPSDDSFLIAWNIFLIRLHSLVMPEYMKFRLDELDGSGYYHALSSGSATKFVSKGNLSAVPIPLPPFSEQKRIVSKVTDLLSQVTRLDSTLTRRDATRTQLLTAAIHGLLNGNADHE